MKLAGDKKCPEEHSWKNSKNNVFSEEKKFSRNFTNDQREKNFAGINFRKRALQTISWVQTYANDPKFAKFANVYPRESLYL